jgi:cell division septal protein FtsQ
MKEQVFIKTDKSGAKRRYLYSIGIIAGIVFIFIGIGAYFYYWSPLLQIREFSIIGTTSEDETRTAIVNYFNSSRSFFSPATDRIVFWMQHNEEFIQSPSFLPYAASIKLTSNISEKKVTAEITPRVMSGVWCANEKCFVFDDNGVVFSEAPDVSGSLILKIRDENNTPVSLGRAVLSGEEFNSIKKAIQSIQKNKIPISEVLIQNMELKEWATVAPNGFSIKFSFNSIPDDLDSVFKGIFERTNIDKLTYIDLRVPNRVYFK